jgi:hypothetical protein
MNALHCDASRLRSELAMAIARKRAPELSFVPVSEYFGRSARHLLRISCQNFLRANAVGW